MSDSQDLGYLENRVAENADSMLFARLAEGLLKVGREDEALEVCRRGLTQHPYYATGYFVLAEVLREKGKLEEAEVAVKRGLELEPTSLWGLRLRADILRSLNWLTNAINVYEKILALDPTEKRLETILDDLRKRQEPEEAIVGEEPGESGVLKPELFEEAGTEGETGLEEETATEEVGEIIEFETEEEAEEASSEQFDQVIEEIFGDETSSVPTEPAKLYPEEHQEELEPPFSAEPEEEVQLEVEPEKPGELEEAETKGESGAAIREVEEIFGETEEEQPLGSTEPPTEMEPPIEEQPAQPEPSEPKLSSEPPRKIVTPTLGEIYAAQGQYAKAIGVFEILREKEPDNPEWEKKIQMLKQKLAEAQDEQ